MKKLLVLSDVFPPAFAPRMGYLVKYLGDFGWDADILCEDNVKDNNFSSLLGKNHVYRVKVDKNVVPKGFITKLWRFLNLKRKFTNNQYPYIKTAKNKLNKNDYSLILVSTAWNLFVLYAGYEISRLWGIPFIADLRDIHEQRPLNERDRGIKSLFANWRIQNFERKILCLRNEALRNAAGVTTVSPFQVEILSSYNSKVKLIYNGFDPEIFYPRTLKPQKVFTIIYLGAIININLRNPGLLFKAINQLKEKKVISPESLRIQFYIPERDKKHIIEHKDFAGIKEFIDFFGYAESAKVPEILSKSSIALILSNLSDEKGPKGIMTTKFFEYLGVERPVLCVRSDEGVLEEIIKNANVGVAARTVDEAYNFILEKWNEWNEKGFTTVTVNQEYKKQFSRKLQARQFVDIFEKVVDSQDNIQ